MSSQKLTVSGAVLDTKDGAVVRGSKRNVLPVAFNDLVAYYPFRQGTGVDVTARDPRFGDTTDYTATVDGPVHKPDSGVHDIQNGANSGAFDFDGVDDDLQPQNASGLNFGTDSFSISFAIKVDTLDTNEGIIEKFGSGAFYQLFKVPDVIAFQTDDGTTLNDLRLGINTTSFVRLTAVRDAQAGELKLFIGSRNASKSVNIVNVDNNGSLLFGDDVTANDNLNGVLDDIRFYDTALTQSQHDQIRSNTIP